MDPRKKSKKTPKPPQGRPISTSLISHSGAQDVSSLSLFSSRGDLFAYVLLAVDKHRLRVYDTDTGQAVADHSVDNALVASMVWGTLELGKTDSSGEPQPSKKKRKKKDSLSNSDVRNRAMEVVILGLSDGSILCFSPSHGRVVCTLSHPSSTTPVTALAAEDSHRRWFIWAASGQDAMLRLWDVNKNEIVGSWKNDDRIPCTSLTIRSISGVDRTDILCANHSIRLLSRVEGTLPQKLSPVTRFTGHSSPVQSMKWVGSEPAPARFVSMAEMDRFLYIWDVPDSPDVDGKAIASIPLDSDARFFALSDFTDSSRHPVLLTISASGKIALYPIPHQISSNSSNRSSAKLSTLQSRSMITSTSKKTSVPALIINATFVHGEEGKIRVARLVRGVRPVFTLAHYLDKNGQFIEDVQLEDVPDTLQEESQPLIPNKRYNEAVVTIGSGIEPGHDENMDEMSVRDIDGDLQVDLAELSLGQRLAAVADVDIRASDSEDEQVSQTKSQTVKKRTKSELRVVPANSLTRTLIQALHSSDTKLIETCLAHSNPSLIRNTVRRIPSQLAIPLLNACVERLARGARAANMKGGGAGASAQRGMTLITWIKTVLAIHTGHLMTVPDLVARLSGLHTTLTSRLALQESLLSLSGRLDMVLSQIEMRSSVAPAPLPPKNGTISSAVKETSTKYYTEGDSDLSDNDDDDAQMEMGVEIEIGDDEGSVEDVELGGDSEDEDEDEDDEAEDDDVDDDHSSGSDISEFIDDEAEEYSEGDEEAEESE